MVRLLKKCLLITILLVFYSVASSEAVNENEIAPAPRLKDGLKWRIGYCESKNFVNYPATFNALIQGLTQLGWLTGTDNLPYARGQEDTRAMWEYLSSHDCGPYIEFVGDAYYSFNNMNESLRGETAAGITDRLNKRQDLDLMIVMGTTAGQALANDARSVPLMVFSTSNAVHVGIVYSNDYSGLDQVWAHMDPDRYRQQIEVFHDIFAFKKLGMVYEDSVSGRALAAIEDVEAVAGERGFEIVRCFVKDNQSDKNAFYREMLEAHRKIAREADAMYISVYTDRQAGLLPDLLAPFYEKKIPVFAQQGAAEVKNGALLSVYRADFSGVGLFGADAITRVLSGANPGSLPQVFVNTPNIVLNLEVADMIGYTPPFDILLIADEIYTKP